MKTALFTSPAFLPDALGVLERNLAHPRHEFWPDSIGLVEAVGPVVSRLQGHRQIAEAYLLGLALKRRGTLASFDRGVRGLVMGERALLDIVPTTPAARRVP